MRAKPLNNRGRKPGLAMALSGFESQVVGAVEKVSESIVSVSSMRLERRFFGLVPLEGQGSGIVLDRGGLIVTNNHVIDGASQVHVSLKDGRTFTGKVVGSDDATDVAVIRVDASELPAADLGDSESVQVGQFVLAIGNALALPGGPTVSMGVLSAKGRPLPGTDFIFEGLLQTDAAVNPGNSGGPLADLGGNVIGMTTMMIPYAQGMGFAIPINTVKKIAQEILENGRVSRRWIGISGVDVTPQLARRYNLQADRGLLVAEVVPRSPAHYAGLRSGDVIVGADGAAVKQTKDLLLAVSKSPAGGLVRLDVNRLGRTGPLDVTPTDAPSFQQVRER
ncbi:MAG: trypsin-like peptidase domain-containing protein [Nitrososphaerota archaeon]|nr:trypsin-like peptidase domain-containing protein [Nitrososphaerota archaeon]MCL5672030.1 trypsin-like peptidase domain-containing protein [Nitrososphaerota archaeon]MDG6911981.1 trypsin-like peptidase domain-containing protein [Nitrososphaerota archaeon]MDG6924541.1 trypsin-like peptidase domain-containing protein [Nitrososphaerota archaeon]MDG6941006.1 trypsin-like peptidase domain-containing protein [Nitrososphaerota archaeon]